MFRVRHAALSRDLRPEALLNIALLVAGVLLLLIAFLDAFWTVLWVDRSGGPLSSRLTTWIWRGTMRVVGRKHHALLSIVGPILLMGILLLWVLLIWAGWGLVFSAGETALLSTRDQTPPDWVGRLYFVGYTLSTMGNGDFQPNGRGWQIATALTSASGMVFITLGVSYILSVIGAVVSKRAFAEQVSGLGGNCYEVLRHAWNEHDFRALDLPLNSLATQIGTLSQQFLAYPVLHYYHPDTPKRSPGIALALLDETLTLLRYGIPEHARPNPMVLRSARSGIRSYLDTLHSATIEPAPEPPRAPDLQKLRETGIPTVSDDDFRAALEELRDRRRKLLALVRNDGWDWPEQD